MAEKKEKQYVSDNAQLMSEWNWEKNNELGLDPNKLTCGSGKKVWWKCSKGHEWQATVPNRNKGSGCPYCSGRLAIKGQNDLQTVNPSIAKEWDNEKNGNLIPSEVLPNRNKRVWWKCSKGHKWQATICNRNKGNNCPICNSERNTSFPEFAVMFYLEKQGIKVIHSYRELGYELDIFIPSRNIAIEYDGYLWHKNKVEDDIKKNRQCQNDGITLYRIREGLLPLKNSSIDYTVQKKQQNLQNVLESVLTAILEKDIEINLERDYLAIENLREYMEKKNSLLLVNPEIAREWNYNKNVNLKPEYFYANSDKKVWWTCAKGHEWKAAIGSRNKGAGCPYCAGQKVIKGYNDLQTTNPHLALEWNYEKNDGLTPKNVMSNSHKKVWWQCSNSHEWQATVAHRNNGTGCPYCSNTKILRGYNDLQTANPILAKEWNYEMNKELTPADILPNSSKKVWWICSKGHEWQTKVQHRNNGSGCPECAKERRKKKSTSDESEKA